MLVKKFEARTIKQAIEMVKVELGPEAIILSAKEHDKGYGLGGEPSFEVTAAISEEKFRNKKAIERRLNQEALQKFKAISARKQKEIIEKATRSHAGGLEMVSEEPERMTTEAAPTMHSPSARRMITPIRYVDIDEAPMTAQSSVPAQKATPISAATNTDEVEKLKTEVNYLKTLLQKFQKMPDGIVPSHAGAQAGISYELSFAYKKLIEAGIKEEAVTEILTKADEFIPEQQKRKRAFVEGWLIKYFLDELRVVDKPFQGRYHIFFGSTGQGKTATLVKFATHLILKEKKKVAILTGDDSKVGTGVQLKTYAQILNVPFGIIDGEVDWVQLDEQLLGVDTVLIDTAGSTMKGAQDMEKLKKCLPKFSGANVQKHYVQSIMTRDKDAFEVADRFKMFQFDDVIFTRLDEALQFGLIYNFQKEYGVPVHSFGIGAALPEGFEIATRERIVDLIFHLSKPQAEKGAI